MTETILRAGLELVKVKTVHSLVYLFSISVLYDLISMDFFLKVAFKTQSGKFTLS